ncbi:JAB domain-containing protein [Paenibacillus harenae]|uniref:JAB domain-containing protein n=1 Tax=Paenibacillus harenae TaxID=306543 RepID=UPI0027905AE3|nr:DNA repair protein RadC [Paenibacillus harenae]MDQ0059457.1 DNA repair protein RadC [Paenibacillus harenae]
MNIYSIKTALADALCVKEDSNMIQELFSRFVTPNELLEASEVELTCIKGVGPAKARQIVSTLKLARALNTPRENPTVIRSPKDVFDIMRFTVGYRSVEEFWILALNTKNHIVWKEKVSIGTINSAIVGVREVYRFLVQRNACSWVALHNHPSGICDPSPEDIQLTNRLVQAGELLNIQLLDHIITSTDSYCSLKERGLM